MIITYYDAFEIKVNNVKIQIFDPRSKSGLPFKASESLKVRIGKENCFHIVNGDDLKEHIQNIFSEGYWNKNIKWYPNHNILKTIKAVIPRSDSDFWGNGKYGVAHETPK